MDFKKNLSIFISASIGMPEEEILSAIETPPDGRLGDFAFPCFKLAKEMKKAPNIIAQELAEKLSGQLPDFLSRVQSSGAFLNFFLNKGFFAKVVLEKILKERDRYGSSDVGKGKTIVIDFSSPNVAKRFHIGHLYSTVIGGVLYKMYNFLGYDSFGINYLGDWGTQFGKLIVAFKKWGERSLIEQNGIEEIERLYVKFHDEAEKDKSLEDEARSWLVKMQNHEEEAISIWKLLCDISIVEYEKQYKRLNIHFDSYLGESFYNDKMPAAVEEIKSKGILKESDGAQIVDLEEYKMPPCLILRKDGGALYPTRDIASALYRKKTYNFHKAVYVTDIRQSLHFAQWFKVIGLLGYEWESDLIHVPYGLLSLEDGALSSRKGKVLLLTDILDEAVRRINNIIEEKNPELENKQLVAEQVGIGAVIFSSLFNSRIKDNVISLDKILSFDGETGPYVQYTHARTASLLEKAGVGEISPNDVDFNVLNDDASFSTLRLLSEYQDKVILAVERFEPFLIARYLIALAQAFNKFYHDNSILTSEQTVKTARLALVFAVKSVIASGLSLLGIAAPEKM